VLHNAVLVPQRAVTELQGLNQIYVVGADNVVHVHTVELGSQIGKDIVVSKGLAAGQVIVTEGLDKLKDGMKVSTQPDTAAAAPAPQGN
jgi:multidrug efflux pump subunit AcrA (membrane-fusion protein)